MALRKKSAAPVEETPAVVEQENVSQEAELKPIDPVEDVKPLVQATEAKVLTPDGQVARVYTLEIHGPTFRELAQQFAGKIGGSVR